MVTDTVAESPTMVTPSMLGLTPLAVTMPLATVGLPDWSMEAK